ncbi:hypothetical protein QTH87_12530 [Variovorax sp. J22P168]|uniref:hypothetical protein n=1 Tax=Variovorax jilinensis TaxID=3053513 RepID=UPI002575588B|nr:hypothetical protein [Variovorax sp. J22P168]MDM0013261.1 hypothetical protein [Variovorax sp. J22P168]
MPDRSDILWFKTEFQPRILPLLAGTPLTVDMIAAIACQETGHIWPVLRRKGMATDRILALCVGDTLDADKGRRAFPKTKAELLSRPGGDRMFAIAHQGLVDMAAQVPGYSAVAARPDKFCHGYGMFQCDLQFFLTDPDYFLERRYAQFEQTLGKCLEELGRALRKLGFERRESLDDHELAAVGIAYNTGGYKPAKGLRQGHFNGTSFYGELLFDFIRLARTAALPEDPAPLVDPPPGVAILPPPTPVAADGAEFLVSTVDSMLRLRSAPAISTPPQANVVANLPGGHRVRAVTGKPVKGFLEVETELLGALLHGFASLKFLAPAPAVPRRVALARGARAAAAAAPFVPPPAALASRPGNPTRRRDPANARSLDEPKQPGRSGQSAEALRAELGAIVDWLAVDNPAFARYQPRAGLTFCNIYSHDYCHLAGVYLPRVWWTSPSLVAMSHGASLSPLIGDTVVEMRANDLFRWLRDYGQAFGWRQTGTLTKLQQAANQGGIGLIVARRREDGRSGHIVAVVPETETAAARRDAAGEVPAPLQSQAGARNFARGTGKANWWNGEEFAESAFWIHA